MHGPETGSPRLDFKNTMNHTSYRDSRNVVQVSTPGPAPNAHAIDIHESFSKFAQSLIQRAVRPAG